MVEDLLNTIRAQIPHATAIPSPATTSSAVTPGATPSPAVNPSRVQQALKRQFPNMFPPREMKRGKGRFSAQPVIVRNLVLNVYVLPGPTNITPKITAELELAQAGLGRRALSLPEDCKHAEIVNLIEEEFTKLKPLQGRWMFFKSTGGNGQRKLTLIPMDTEGYNGRQLRAVSNNGKNVLFIVPLQQELDTEPLPFNAPEFSRMPQVCPVCQQEFPTSSLAIHANICAESSFFSGETGQPDMEVPGPSFGNALMTQTTFYSTPIQTEWKKAESPAEAIRLFCEELRQGGQHLPPLLLSLNAKDNEEERGSALICFYKDRYDKQQWSAPFKCCILGDAAVGVGVTRHILSSVIHKLKHGFNKNLGNAAITALFEGEMDHLVPSLSVAILECDLFNMAGRMIGHSVIHNGPPLAGLSLAVVDALIYGTKEIATPKLCLEDCAELDHRQTISLLLKDEWSNEDSARVNNLCMEWYLPLPTKDSNRLLLFQKLRSHAVLRRASDQIKQLRKGLKDTGIWPLLISRPDVIPLVFPREHQVNVTSQAILESIKWPKSNQKDSDSDSDDDVPEDTITLITISFEPLLNKHRQTTCGSY